MKTATNTMQSARPQTTKQQGLAPTAQKNTKPIIYQDVDGNNVELSLFILNNFLAPGEKFTEAESWGYFQLCQARRMNPVLKDCFLTRFNGKPTIVVSRDLYNKRANACANYDGKESGVCFLTKDGVLERRKGTLVLDNETLVGAWCDVYMKNRKYPESVEINFKEAARYKGDGELMATWATQPAWMVVKVAEARALKAAIPEEFSGTYSAEELGVEEPTDMPVIPKEEPKKSAPIEAQDVDYEAVDETTGEVLSEDELQDSFFGEE